MLMLPATRHRIDNDSCSTVRTKLRIGFLSTEDPNDVNALSGMPHRMQTILESRGVSIVRLGASLGTSQRRLMNQLVNSSLLRSLPHGMRSSLQTTVGKTRWCLEKTFSGRTYRTMLARARVASRLIEQEIAHLDLDVVFGSCISTLLYDLQVAVPIVYFSDATARLINDNYPKYIRRSPSYKAACDELERNALGRVAAGVFASNWARNSAVKDYGLADERAFVAPMGANVVPNARQADNLSIDPPSNESLELCLVAADPMRKRLNLAIDITCRLQARGINARLTYIGPPTHRAVKCRFVKCVGRFQLSRVEDTHHYRNILRESHLMLLPSVGEAFGIAPCEAAHFARPSIVSDAGGLPEVVKDNVTGIVISRKAGAESYVKEIVELVSDPDRYYQMCEAAQQRAAQRLSWDNWADKMVQVMEMVTAGLVA